MAKMAPLKSFNPRSKKDPHTSAKSFLLLVACCLHLAVPIASTKVDTKLKLLINEDELLSQQQQQQQPLARVFPQIPPQLERKVAVAPAPVTKHEHYNLYHSELKRLSYETIHRILRDENEPNYRKEDSELRYYQKRSLQPPTVEPHTLVRRSIKEQENNKITLSLKGTDLKNFIVNCSQLQHIDLSHNQLSLLNLSDCQHVQQLDVSFNKLDSLPFNLSSANSSLQELNLNNNLITTAIAPGLFQLHALHLSGNRINNLMALNISQLSSLQVLDLSCNLISSLETAFFPERMHNLRELNLANNSLKVIYRTTFYNLLSLNTLILRNNQIREVDYETFLALPNLQYLDLSHNQLQADSIRALQGIPDLVSLSIAYNPDVGAAMQEFVASWSLKELDASGTGLCQIPAALAQSVRTLKLTDNWLQVINCGDLDSYPLLQYLDLSHSRIEDIEDDALGRLEILRTLMLDHNKLRKVPVSLPTTLEHLFLQHNEIMDIHESTFQSLKNLQTLDLSENRKLLYLPALQLPKLLTLNLQGSGIKGVSQAIVHTLPRLRDLLLEDNPIKCNDLLGIAEWASPCRERVAMPLSSTPSAIDGTARTEEQLQQTDVGQQTPTLLISDVVNSKINLKQNFLQEHNFFANFKSDCGIQHQMRQAKIAAAEPDCALEANEQITTRTIDKSIEKEEDVNAAKTMRKYQANKSKVISQFEAKPSNFNPKKYAAVNDDARNAASVGGSTKMPTPATKTLPKILQKTMQTTHFSTTKQNQLTAAVIHPAEAATSASTTNEAKIGNKGLKEFSHSALSQTTTQQIALKTTIPTMTAATLKLVEKPNRHMSSEQLENNAAGDSRQLQLTATNQSATIDGSNHLTDQILIAKLSQVQVEVSTRLPATTDKTAAETAKHILAQHSELLPEAAKVQAVMSTTATMTTHKHEPLQLHIKDRHLIGTPLLMHKGENVLVESEQLRSVPTLATAKTIENNMERNLAHSQASQTAANKMDDNVNEHKASNALNLKAKNEQQVLVTNTPIAVATDATTATLATRDVTTAAEAKQHDSMSLPKNAAILAAIKPQKDNNISKNSKKKTPVSLTMKKMTITTTKHVASTPAANENEASVRNTLYKKRLNFKELKPAAQQLASVNDGTSNSPHHKTVNTAITANQHELSTFAELQPEQQQKEAESLIKEPTPAAVSAAAAAAASSELRLDMRQSQSTGHPGIVLLLSLSLFVALLIGLLHVYRCDMPWRRHLPQQRPHHQRQTDDDAHSFLSYQKWHHSTRLDPPYNSPLHSLHVRELQKSNILNADVKRHSNCQRHATTTTAAPKYPAAELLAKAVAAGSFRSNASTSSSSSSANSSSQSASSNSSSQSGGLNDATHSELATDSVDAFYIEMPTASSVGHLKNNLHSDLLPMELLHMSTTHSRSLDENLCAIQTTPVTAGSGFMSLTPSPQATAPLPPSPHNLSDSLSVRLTPSARKFNIW